jgi:hypothetical protein
MEHSNVRETGAFMLPAHVAHDGRNVQNEMEVLDSVYVKSWPPLCLSGQSSWLQIQRSGFDSRRYQIFWEAVGLERGPLSPVSTIYELSERKSSGYSVETRYYDRRDSSRWPLDTLYPQKLALTSPTISDCSVGTVLSGGLRPLSFFLSCSYGRPLLTSVRSNLTK